METTGRIDRGDGVELAFVHQDGSDPTVVFRSTRMLSIGKYIERIADHATNIGELVVFMVRGLDVRHTGPASNNPPA